MKTPMTFPSFIRRLKRQMEKYKMKLRYGLSSYGIEEKKGVFRPEVGRRKCACMVGVAVCGQEPLGSYWRTEEATLAHITGWTDDQVDAAERGFEQRPDPESWHDSPFLPFYEFGQKIRTTMGKAA